MVNDRIHDSFGKITFGREKRFYDNYSNNVKFNSIKRIDIYICLLIQILGKIISLNNSIKTNCVLYRNKIETVKTYHNAKSANSFVTHKHISCQC